MSDFSPSDAALEGFRVLGRHWRVVAGWGVFNLLAWIAMIMVSAVALLILLAASGGGETPSAVSGVVGGLVSGVGLLLIGAILACGVFRLMLRPEEPAFLHLRLGPDELRNLALTLAVPAAVAGLGWAAGLVGGWLGPEAGLVRTGLFLAVLAVAAWAYVRLALALPWTFDARRFSFAGPWRASRKRGWPLAGMFVLNLSLIGVVALSLWLALFLATGLATGFEGLFASLSNAEAMEARPGRYLMQLAAQVLLWPIFTVLATAPLAAAYKALRD